MSGEIIVDFAAGVRIAKGPVTQRILQLTAEGCTLIRRTMVREGFKDASIKSALKRLRTAGEIRQQAKAIENRYQIRIHPIVAGRINRAAERKGIKPGTLAKMLLHNAGLALPERSL